MTPRHAASDGSLGTLPPALVSLAGAGPGDPALITVGAVARLSEADVVVYDRLANPALLRYAREGTELVYAGKAPGAHAMTQDEINAFLVAKAREGKRVVRLKGGDPFVFGRGGEEALALAEAGVPFEVIPGVTSAVAAPAYAGIPVTHRGVGSSFVVVTAQEGNEKPADRPGIDWDGISHGADTLVFLMGVDVLDEIASQLIAHGRAGETPVAVIEWGTHVRQRTVTATLATIAGEVRDAGLLPPSVTVVGEVARLREKLRWFDARPLWGKRVLVTRTREQASQLSSLLAAYGAEPVELPTIEIVETASEQEVATAIDLLRASAYNWVLFTSPNAIRIFMRRLRESGFDARAFAGARITAVGPGSADALAREGIAADLVPEQYVAEGLIKEFEGRPVSGQRFLCPRAEDARESLLDALRGRGAVVDELVLYRAGVPSSHDADGVRLLRDGKIDMATFASSSAVRNLLGMLDGDVTPLQRVKIAAIGPVTSKALRDAGLDVAIEPRTYSIPGLVQAIVEAMTPEGAR